MFVVATFFVLLVAPERWRFPFGLACCAIVGVWSMFYPQGMLGWVKTAYPGIDADDPSIWWVPRLIGACFVVFTLLITFIGFWR
jgi:hypothetical protein